MTMTMTIHIAATTIPIHATCNAPSNPDLWIKLLDRSPARLLLLLLVLVLLLFLPYLATVRARHHHRRHVHGTLEIAFAATPVRDHRCISDGSIRRNECFGRQSDLEPECPLAEPQQIVFARQC